MNDENVEIEILHWDLVATWSFDLRVETCTICRNHIMDLCIECQNDTKNGKCNVVWGKCGHAFHKHCIDRWLNTKHVCPLDTQVWVEETGEPNEKTQV